MVFSECGISDVKMLKSFGGIQKKINKLDTHFEKYFAYSKMDIVLLFFKRLLLIKIIPYFNFLKNKNSEIYYNLQHYISF